MKTRNRIVSFLLALIMVMSFSLPAFAEEIVPVQEIVSVSEPDGGEAAVDTEPEAAEDGGEAAPPDDSFDYGTEEPGAPDADAGGEADAASEEDAAGDGAEAEPEPDAEVVTFTSAPAKEQAAAPAATPTDAAPPALDIPDPGVAGDGSYVLNCSPEQAAELIDYYEFVSAQIARGSNPRQRAAVGDSGSVSWIWGESVGITVPSGDPGNPYYIGSIPRISLSTADMPVGRPFCVEFGSDPGGSYTASEGSDDTILGLLVAFEENDATAVGVQLALWYLESGLPLSDQPQASAALSAGQNANTDGYTYYLWTGGGGAQPFVTLDRAGDTPPDIPDEPDEPGEGDDNPDTRTEVTTETETRTEVRSNTEYVYSDAIGQITVAKRDSEGNSLDGAVFNIVVEFANGQRGGDSAFEVHNGSRLFTWTHPADDHAPARVTVTEVRVPEGYIGDTTPQTAIVAPTYTRVTKILTHTITITTTHTTTSVIEIESGKVLSTSTASDDAEAELNPPVVQEATDFIAGDRETTVTFVNRPKPATLTIYKYSKGTYSQALAGAKFRIRYADPSVSAQVWELSTGADGKITIDLPYDGTLVIEELEAPPNHVIGPVSSWTVTVAKGEDKRVDISNDKLTSLIAYKRDSVTGQLLGGAVIRATLLRSHTTPYESGIVHTATTDPHTGEAHFTGLIPGEWRVEEISPPPFYLGTETVHTVNIYDGSFEPVTVEFENDRYSGLTLIKLDSVTGERLQGAVFSLYRGTEIYSTAFLGDFQSNQNGMVIIEDLESNQWYTAVEKNPPQGYELDPENAVQTVFITPEALDQNLTIIFRNPPKPKLLIEKTDSAGNPLAGAVFRLSKEDSADYIEVTTGPDGSVLVENLSETWYTCSEIRSPEGFLLDGQKHTVELRVGRTTTLVVENKANPKLTIRKIDEQTLAGIEGVTLRITKDGAAEYQDIITGPDGVVTVPLSPGWFFVQERIAKPGYQLDEKIYSIELVADEDSELVITNRKQPSLKIVKYCSATGNPLQATFSVAVKNGRSLGEFTTDPATGELLIENLDYSSDPLILTIRETRGPDGYLATPEPMEVTIGWGEQKVIQWPNDPENPILIYKRDVDGNPIGGVEFLVTTVNGAHAATVTTDETSGVAVVPGLEPGWYTVRETRTGGEEYILDSSPKQVELRVGAPASVTFINDRLPTLQIIKRNKVDGQPMPGVLISVAYMDGERIGEYRTDEAGMITLTAKPGWVTVVERETLQGFTLDQTPITAELLPNKTAMVQLYNVPLPGLQIRKSCSVSGKPLAGVQFKITRLDRGLIGTYTTDAQGIIYLDIDEPSVIVTEVRTIEGYRLDDRPRTITLSPGELKIESWENTPFPVLEIVKLDAQTKQPLAGVKYKIFDGTMRELGIYTTNSLGRIVLTGMAEGKFFVQEHDASAAGPYILDKTVYEVSLSYGKTTRVELLNSKMGTLRIKKISAETGEPLAGAVYLIYDAKGNILGEYTTNTYGLIELDSSLEPQKIKLKEISAPPNYVLDSTVYEAEIKAGSTAELVLENEPVRGVIQIIKKAAEANTITKDKAGAVLAGAVFEIVNEKLEVVDTITSDARGMATSKDLPTGKYAIREKTAPDFYLLDDAVFYGEIKLPGDVVRFEVLNTPADVNVTIEKRGNVEALAGDLIRYDFSNISNASNIALEGFFWHDQLPTDAVRLETLSTGVWSERLSYRVVYKTNLKTAYRVWRDGLLSTVNNELSVAELKLAANEFVTDFKVEFGEVEPGFHEVEAPFLMTRVLEDLPHEYRFVNKADVGAKLENEVIYSTDSWVTIAFGAERGPLPRTGY